MNIWGYNSSIWPNIVASHGVRCAINSLSIIEKKKIANDICDLEPSSVYNCMALIVFGQTARLISSSSLVPAGWQAAGQLQEVIKKGSMEQVIPHNKCAHTTCLPLHFSEPYMLALQFANVCHKVEDVCQPRTAKRALLRKINGVSATVKFAPDGVSTWSGSKALIKIPGFVEMFAQATTTIILSQDEFLPVVVGPQLVRPTSSTPLPFTIPLSNRSSNSQTSWFRPP